MDEFRAAIWRDGSRDFLADTIRLMVWRRPPYGGRPIAMLMADGRWEPVEEGTTGPADAGIALPAQAVEALAKAIEQFQGHASHADTESRVLREWLAVEKARVDAALNHGGE